MHKATDNLHAQKLVICWPIYQFFYSIQLAVVCSNLVDKNLTTTQICHHTILWFIAKSQYLFQTI